MDQKQMVWHAYHAESLCQLVDLEARRQEIEQIKPEYELPTRRRLMKPVVGQLPPVFVVVCKAWNEASKACDEAWETYNEVYKAWDEARDKAWKTYDEAYDKTCNAWDEADKARDEACKAWDEAYELHKDEIERLHAEECPDCPWDGKSIFPE